MDYEREHAIQERIEILMQEFASATESLPAGAFVPSDALVAVMVELDDLQNELRVVRGDSSDEPDSMIRVPLKPRPHTSSGAIALPAPEEE